MDIDERLAQALRQYSHLRRDIGRGIAHSVPDLAHHGGKDMLMWIDRLGGPNVTALAEAMGMTRGGASKGAAKLKAAGFIESYQLPDNRKEIYWRLTPKGEGALSRLHRAFEDLHAQEALYLATLEEGQKRAVLDFLEGFTKHLAGAWPSNPALETPEKEA